MNEKEKGKRRETQYDVALSDKNKKLSLDSRQWDLTKKSTQASNNLNCDINLTQTSVQNIYGENTFKIQYEKVKKEEHSDKSLKRSFKFPIKIDHKEILKLKKSRTSEVKENTNIRSDLVEVKGKNNNPNSNNDLNKSNFKDKNNEINNNYLTKSNKGLSNTKIRKDAFGEKIVKENKKKFKVSFFDFLQNKDEVKNSEHVDVNNKKSNLNSNAYTYNFATANDSNPNRQFIKVIKVESFKKYNLHLNEQEYDKVVCKPCGCNIF